MSVSQYTTRYLAALALAFTSGAAFAAQFEVTTLSDEVDLSPGDGLCVSSSGCSLRAAVMEANASEEPDTILLSAETYTLTLAGNQENEALSGDLDVLAPLTVAGADATLHGGGLDRLFEAIQTDLTLTDLTLTGGFSTGKGGAVQSERGQLTLTNVSLRQNRAYDDGGALHATGGSVTLANCTFEENSGYGGGAVSIEQAAATITDCQFVANSSMDGGALYLTTPIQVDLDGNSFDANSAAMVGGAVYLSGYTGTEVGAFSVNDTDFTDNSAIAGNGGALYVAHMNGNLLHASLAMTNCRFDNNRGAAGGAVFVAEGLLTLGQCEFTSNTATHVDGFAGALYVPYGAVLNDTTLTGNLAEGLGGALFTEGTLTLSNVAAQDNTSLGDEIGNGIYIGDEYLTLPDSDGDGVNDGEDAFPNDPDETLDTDGDGIGNNQDNDDDGDGVIDSDDDFPLDPDRTTDVDTDGDGVTDVNDAFPQDASETLDTDSDGIGNNADADDDNDGFSDEEELRVHAAPLDANDGPEQHRPSQPQLLAVVADSMAPLHRFDLDVSLFSDPDESGPASEIALQIIGPIPAPASGGTGSGEEPENGIVFAGSVAAINPLQLPAGLLQSGTEYDFYLRYIDNSGLASPFSEPTTVTLAAVDPNDTNANGIEDRAELEGEFDLDGDGTADSDAGYTVIADAQSGMPLSIRADVGQLTAIRTYSDVDLPDLNQGSLPVGMIGFRIDGLDPGAEVFLSILLSEPLVGGRAWWQYDPNGGLTDLTQSAEFANQSVVVRYVDGGVGDQDGVANGRIIDPSGPMELPATSSGSDGDGRCFVATAVFGEHAEETQALRWFRDQYLLSHAPGRMFVRWYYQHSPTWVEWSSQYPWLGQGAELVLTPIAWLAGLLME